MWERTADPGFEEKIAKALYYPLHVLFDYKVLGPAWFKKHCGMKLIKVRVRYFKGCWVHKEKNLKEATVYVCACETCDYSEKAFGYF